MKRTALAFVAVFAISACVPRVEQPEVWLGSVRLASVGLTGGVVDLQLAVYNPNSFHLRATGVTYDVDFEAGAGDWLEFAEGVAPGLDVAPGDTAMVVVPVEFSYRGLGRAIRNLMERGSFEYRVEGVVALEGPLRRDIRYRHAGTVTPRGVR